MTDAPDAVQQLIAKWPHTGRGEYFAPTTHVPEECFRCQLDHLHQTVLLPMTETLRSARMVIEKMLDIHEGSIVGEIDDRLAAWDAQEGKHD
jgi:hypothetical protein